MSFIKAMPAAQYLRMSTEHQRYSLQNQDEANRAYATIHGFEVVKTYSDVGRSGVLLKGRPGLVRLLNDVVRGDALFRAVLVYDVSRWGRFQDCDEPAHYEFICKSAGVPVHYCAESFANDNTLQSSIVKALKRTMAAEYSREMGEKSFAGCKRLAELGFKQGGTAGYGLRRLMISADGQEKRMMSTGELKSLKTDRVILIPGPEVEVQCVREMYCMVANENRTPYYIARELNRRGVDCPEGKWRVGRVCRILTDPKYAGYNVWNRTSRRLGHPTVQVPRANWLLRPRAFKPIVEPQLFEKTQVVLADQRQPYSEEELLGSLRKLLAAKGKLSYRIMQESHSLPSANTFIRRFGSLRRAFELAGHHYPWTLAAHENCHAGHLQDTLLDQIKSIFPEEISICQAHSDAPCYIQVDGHLTVLFIMCPAIRRKGQLHWVADRRQTGERPITLLGRLDADNAAFRDFYVLPGPPRHWIRHRGELKKGIELAELSELCAAVRAIASRDSGVTVGRFDKAEMA